MVYLSLKAEQLKAIYNGGVSHYPNDDDRLVLLFIKDGINVSIEFKNIEQFKNFMFYLQNANENIIELERIKSFIDPDKRKDE